MGKDFKICFQSHITNIRNRIAYHLNIGLKRIVKEIAIERIMVYLISCEVFRPITHTLKGTYIYIRIFHGLYNTQTPRALKGTYI